MSEEPEVTWVDGEQESRMLINGGPTSFVWDLRDMKRPVKAVSEAARAGYEAGRRSVLVAKGAGTTPSHVWVVTTSYGVGDEEMVGATKSKPDAATLRSFEPIKEDEAWREYRDEGDFVFITRSCPSYVEIEATRVEVKP